MKFNSIEGYFQCGRFKVVPPLSDDFKVYGDDDVQTRVREWAIYHRYALIRGLPVCAHGAYLTPCSEECRPRVLDHTDWWVDASEERSKYAPFLLSHPYDDPTEDVELWAYAKAHSMELGFPKWDGWYGHGTKPVALYTGSQWRTTPLQDALTLLLVQQPVAWACRKLIETTCDECTLSSSHTGPCDSTRTDVHMPDWIRQLNWKLP